MTCNSFTTGVNIKCKMVMCFVNLSAKTHERSFEEATPASQIFCHHPTLLKYPWKVIPYTLDGWCGFLSKMFLSKKLKMKEWDCLFHLHGWQQKMGVTGNITGNPSQINDKLQYSVPVMSVDTWMHVSSGGPSAVGKFALASNLVRTALICSALLRRPHSLWDFTSSTPSLFPSAIILQTAMAANKQLPSPGTSYTRKDLAETSVDPSEEDPVAQEGTASSAGPEVTRQGTGLLWTLGAAGLAKQCLVVFSGPPGVRAVKEPAWRWSRGVAGAARAENIPNPTVSSFFMACKVANGLMYGMHANFFTTCERKKTLWRLDDRTCLKINVFAVRRGRVSVCSWEWKMRKGFRWVWCSEGRQCFQNQACAEVWGRRQNLQKETWAGVWGGKGLGMAAKLSEWNIGQRFGKEETFSMAIKMKGGQRFGDGNGLQKCTRAFKMKHGKAMIPKN